MTDMDHEDCDKAVSQLYEYLDGELDGHHMQVVEAHIRACSPCLEAFDFHDELRRVISAKCAQSMPADFRARILLLIAEASESEDGGS